MVMGAGRGPWAHSWGQLSAPAVWKSHTPPRSKTIRERFIFGYSMV